MPLNQNKKSYFLYRYSRYLKLLFLLGDFIFINIAYLLSFIIRFGNFERLHSEEAVMVLAIINVVLLFLVNYISAYKFIRVEPIEKNLMRSLKMVTLHMIITFTLIVFINFDSISRLRMVYFYGLFFIEVFFLRILFIQLLKKYRKSGFNYRNVIIIGSGNVSKELQDVLLKDLAYGYRVLGHFSDNNTNGENSLGGINDAINYIKNDLVHEVYFTLTNYKEEALRELVNYCENNLIRIKFIPDFQQITRNRKISIDFYDSLPVVSLRKEPLEAAQNRIVKRVFDFLFSLGIILLVFPWLFPVLMILIKCGSKGPIFFVQHRSGENNRSFSCLKFRTMRVNTEADELQASKNDVRITGIGKFLRKTNLDELPQFFNVLIGDMSVVGPRPHMLKHTEDYSKLVEGYLVRHFTRPGITGWAQVNGFRGETKELDQMKKRVEYDVWYIENWSFLLDVKIIFNTIFNMASGEKNAG